MPLDDRPDATGALAGYSVGVTAARRREELGAALERHGARVVYGPAIRTVPLADDSRLRDATSQCLGQPPDIVITTTAVGFRGWLEAAAVWGQDAALHGVLGDAEILTRGPKVRGAVRAAGLRERWSPESESSAEVLDHLLARPGLAGARIAIQLHGDPLRDVVDGLRAAGAHVVEVPVYRWEPPADPAPLRALIAAVADARLDAVTFTSAPAAENFLRTADDAGLGGAVRDAVRDRVLAVAVGPVTAAPLLAAGVTVVQPERFRLGALVRTVVEQLPGRTPADDRGARTR
ncbi:uroporphyrinogen-III synthase [uncultured Jatrophihabitans sp.]|uniref:uroporphyrinogen-III synthase n=1 Tax=uncultured Jatrophihabitans sp. TaxID=1610747 RepID=UPI0035C9F2CC